MLRLVLQIANGVILLGLGSVATACAFMADPLFHGILAVWMIVVWACLAAIIGTPVLRRKRPNVPAVIQPGEIFMPGEN